MKVIRVPGVLGRMLAGVLGIFGWKPDRTRR